MCVVAFELPPGPRLTLWVCFGHVWVKVCETVSVRAKQMYECVIVLVVGAVVMCVSSAFWCLPVLGLRLNVGFWGKAVFCPPPSDLIEMDASEDNILHTDRTAQSIHLPFHQKCSMHCWLIWSVGSQASTAAWNHPPLTFLVTYTTVDRCFSLHWLGNDRNWWCNTRPHPSDAFNQQQRGFGQRTVWVVMWTSVLSIYYVVYANSYTVSGFFVCIYSFSPLWTHCIYPYCNAVLLFPKIV